MDHVPSRDHPKSPEIEATPALRSHVVEQVRTTVGAKASALLLEDSALRSLFLAGKVRVGSQRLEKNLVELLRYLASSLTKSNEELSKIVATVVSHTSAQSKLMPQ